MDIKQSEKNLVDQLQTAYTLKQIEEKCGMPSRTIQVSRNIPRKYVIRLNDLYESTFAPITETVRAGFIRALKTKKGSPSLELQHTFQNESNVSHNTKSFTSQLIEFSKHRLNEIKREEKELLLVLSKLEEVERDLETANVKP